MTFFYDLMPRSLKKFCFIISTAVSLTFFALLGWFGAFQVLDEWELGVTSDALAIPTCIYSSVIPVFSAIIIIRILQAARITLREKSQKPIADWKFIGHTFANGSSEFVNEASEGINT